MSRGRPFSITKADRITFVAWAVGAVLCAPFALVGSDLAAVLLAVALGGLAGVGLVYLAAFSSRWGESAARFFRAAGTIAWVVVLAAPLVLLFPASGTFLEDFRPGTVTWGGAFAFAVSVSAAASRSLKHYRGASGGA